MTRVAFFGRAPVVHERRKQCEDVPLAGPHKGSGLAPETGVRILNLCAQPIVSGFLRVGCSATGYLKSCFCHCVGYALTNRS